MTGLNITRRQTVAGLFLSSLASGPSIAASAGADGITKIDLWPRGAPGAPPILPLEREIPRSPTGPVDDTAFLHVTNPCLYRCDPEDLGVKPNGASILLIPGGGYVRVAIGHGGHALLKAFAAKGYVNLPAQISIAGRSLASRPGRPAARCAARDAGDNRRGDKRWT